MPCSGDLIEYIGERYNNKIHLEPSKGSVGLCLGGCRIFDLAAEVLINDKIWQIYIGAVKVL